MNWLEKRAAREASRFCVCGHNQCRGECHAAVAAAIEAVAREFAERAVRAYQVVLESKGLPEHPDDIDRCLAKAMAAADE